MNSFFIDEEAQIIKGTFDEYDIEERLASNSLEYIHKVRADLYIKSLAKSKDFTEIIRQTNISLYEYICQRLKEIKEDFDIDGQEDSYPDKIDGKICFWNWNENNTDYALGFAKYVEECLPKGVSIFTEVLAQFDYYEQWRGEYRPIVKAINEIFSSMEQRGYLKSYILKADNYQKIWDYFTGMVAGTVGLYMCDPKAFKDKLLVERINVLLEACSIEYNGNSDPIYGLLVEKDTDQPNLDLPHYFLQDANNKTYLSKKPGTLGGHYKLKIYGRLDCPSAARYIAKGQYVRHRVFFEDEDTAIAAGYRPCGICMKEAYRKWKENHLSGDKRQ